MAAGVVQGLKAVADAPLRSGFVQALATWDRADGAAARLEAGLHPFANTDVFAFGEWNRAGPGVGAGIRYTFDW